MITLFTLGYQRWNSAIRLERLIETLKKNQITKLVDIRHSPCASQLDPESNYGPRSWHLQENADGIEAKLKEVNIGYLWLVELGNPQKQDRAMRIFKTHLDSPDENISAQRGLKILETILKNEGNRVCLLCACKMVSECHRTLVAEKISERIKNLRVVHL